ncbi:hypothetical protein PUN28_013231 [Cardiocondyla obscurior]|uniref:Uncharacterized protein n=1 Tax=Cardiocondyla obscurior TaxID=286306 RepID=A0AAW2FD56_9HYME
MMIMTLNARLEEAREEGSLGALTLEATSRYGGASRLPVACKPSRGYFRITLLRSVAETGWPNLRKATYPSPNLKVKYGYAVREFSARNDTRINYDDNAIMKSLRERESFYCAFYTVTKCIRHSLSFNVLSATYESGLQDRLLT